MEKAQILSAHCVPAKGCVLGYFASFTSHLLFLTSTEPTNLRTCFYITLLERLLEMFVVLTSTEPTNLRIFFNYFLFWTSTEPTNLRTCSYFSLLEIT